MSELQTEAWLRQKIFFHYRNRLDDGTLTATSEALPVTNLQRFNLTDKWRSEDLSVQRIDWAGAGVPIRLLGVWDHNITDYGRIRFVVSNNADFSDPVYEYEGPPRASFYNWGVAPYGTFLWGGWPEIVDRLYPRFCLLLLRQYVVGKYVRFEIIENENANVDGYVQAGRCMIGDVWQPQFNFSYGWSHEFVDPSRQFRTEGGAVFIDKRRPRRAVQIPFNFMTRADAQGFAAEIAGAIGYSKELLVVPFPGDPSQQARTSVYGFIRPGTLLPQTEVSHNRYTWGLTVEEITG